MFIPAYDTSLYYGDDRALTVVQVDSAAEYRLDSVVLHLVGGLGAWDGVYFHGIAVGGYDYEQMFAFGPLFPLLSRMMSILFSTWLSPGVAILLAGIIISNVAFVLAATSFLQLRYPVPTPSRNLILTIIISQLLFLKDSTAITATLLFCITPASIFMSAFYSESLFASLTFAGIVQLQHGHITMASLAFAATTATSSNGILNVLFIIFEAFRRWTTVGRVVGRDALLLLLHCILVLLPWVAIQGYGYWLFCMHGDRPFCHESSPLIYPFVQSHYWNVGLFKYWTFAQLPQFILATPMFLAAVLALKDFWNLIYAELQLQHASGVFKSSESYPLPLERACMMNKIQNLLYIMLRSQLTPFLVTLGFLSLSCLLMMHVQIVTRLLGASCPAVYWVLAQPARRHLLPWVVGTSVVYLVVGSILFSTFYPWT